MTQDAEEYNEKKYNGNADLAEHVGLKDLSDLRREVSTMHDRVALCDRITCAATSLGFELSDTASEEESL